MTRQLRKPERVFRMVLWLVAIFFAIFLSGLSTLVERDLPTAGPDPGLDSFIDAHKTQAIDQQLEDARSKQADQQDAAERANLELKAARTQYQSDKDGFSNWIATRQATQLPSQDAALIAHTQALDASKARVDAFQHEVDQLDRDAAALERRLATLEMAQDGLRQAAEGPYEAALRHQALRVFAVRLALTLPLLVAAGYLLVRWRRSAYWPFIWGFTFFALFAFFVELVPYLPSYGGYVRYFVGLVLTVLAGRYAILSMQRYLQRQREAEGQEESARRRRVTYEHALKCSLNGSCPGCERQVRIPRGQAVEETTVPGFCMHCGMKQLNRCAACASLHNAFFHFCPDCGAAEAPGEPACDL